jgi:hypothetical protein
MKHTDIRKLADAAGLDPDEGFACGTCGTGFKTYEERIGSAKRYVEQLNQFYEETGRMPSEKELAGFFEDETPPGDLIYELDSEA